MSGYVRQSAGVIITGNTIQASDSNNEYNALLAAFDASSGHTHSGNTGEGAKLVPLSLTGLSATTGMISQINATTFAPRTLTGTSNRVTITNGDGVAGNPTFDIAATYVGQISINTVGTIVTGTWSGLFGAVSGANLTNLTAANISAGTAGIDISGNAATATTATTSGNATTATALQTSRNFSIAGSTGLSAATIGFNGTADVALSLTGTLDADNGGTGFASYAVGDLLQAATSTTLSKLASVATGNVLISGGVTTVSSWGKVGLTTHVSGTLPVANGGTGVTTSTGTTNLVLSDSPTLTGTPLAPTATAGTNTTQIATTAFVQANKGLTLGTPVNTTSGTSIDFTSIPSGVTQINLMFDSVSTNGSTFVVIQLGDSGGIETSGYIGGTSLIQDSASPLVTSSTASFPIYSGNPGGILSGCLSLKLMDSATNTWAFCGNIYNSGFTIMIPCGGRKSLSAVLDRVRLTTSTGIDTFDGGVFNISYS